MAASESRLQGLQIQSLKVDRSFISTMHDHGDSQEIVKLIVAMAHTLMRSI
jgi:EAL domain-containing protein (putative c-di-GMP-specific phosphodiesterase class I)